MRLNGQDLGILWKAPFRVDITKVAKAGDNELEVRVTNLWPNRLIGDEQYAGRLPMGRHPLEAVARVDAEGRAAAREGTADVHHLEALAQGLAAATLRPARAGEAADAGKSAGEVMIKSRGDKPGGSLSPQ